jgi:hypothetical protein
MASYNQSRQTSCCVVLRMTRPEWCSQDIITESYSRRFYVVLNLRASPLITLENYIGPSKNWGLNKRLLRAWNKIGIKIVAFYVGEPLWRAAQDCLSDWTTCRIHNTRSDGSPFHLARDEFAYASTKYACTTAVRLLVENRIWSSDYTRFLNLQT